MSEGVTLLSKTYKDKVESTRQSLSQATRQDLINDMTRLREEKTDYDVVFKVENESFFAHSAILRARAPAFCSNFLSLCKPEAGEMSVDIQGMEAQGFEAFMRSVYSEDAVEDYNVSKDLWSTAQQSGIEVNSTQDILQKDSVFSSGEETGTSLAKEVGGVNLKDARLVYSCPLGKDLLQLIGDEENSDIVFILEGQPIHAYKPVLCARSEYFAAMLQGGWSETQAKEVTLQGVSLRGFLVVLQFIFGGIVDIPSYAYVGDVLSLADMYGLEGLKEVASCSMKINQCHLFHKPCTGCLGQVPDVLEFASMHHLTSLKESCLRWFTQYYDRALCSKSFARLPASLQEEVFKGVEKNLGVNSAMNMLQDSDRMKTSIPYIAWAEPLHAVVSRLQISCLIFIANNFPEVAVRKNFLSAMKSGFGTSTHLFEKIYSAVVDNLTADNCCRLFCAAVKLEELVCVREANDSDAYEPIYDQDIAGMTKKLTGQCRSFIIANLLRVISSEGWAQLTPPQQQEIKEASVFVDFGSDQLKKPPKLSSSTRQQSLSARGAACSKSSSTAASRTTLQPARPKTSAPATGPSARRPPPGKSVGRKLPLNPSTGTRLRSAAESSRTCSSRDNISRPSSSAGQHQLKQKTQPSSGTVRSKTGTDSSKTRTTLQSARPAVNKPSDSASSLARAKKKPAASSGASLVRSLQKSAQAKMAINAATNRRTTAGLRSDSGADRSAKPSTSTSGVRSSTPSTRPSLTKTTSQTHKTRLARTNSGTGLRKDPVASSERSRGAAASAGPKRNVRQSVSTGKPPSSATGKTLKSSLTVAGASKDNLHSRKLASTRAGGATRPASSSVSISSTRRKSECRPASCQSSRTAAQNASEKKPEDVPVKSTETPQATNLVSICFSSKHFSATSTPAKRTPFRRRNSFSGGNTSPVKRPQLQTSLSENDIPNACNSTVDKPNTLTSVRNKQLEKVQDSTPKIFKRALPVVPKALLGRGGVIADSIADSISEQTLDMRTFCQQSRQSDNEDQCGGFVAESAGDGQDNKENLDKNQQDSFQCGPLKENFVDSLHPGDRSSGLCERLGPEDESHQLKDDDWCEYGTGPTVCTGNHVGNGACELLAVSNQQQQQEQQQQQQEQQQHNQHEQQQLQEQEIQQQEHQEQELQ